MLQCQEHHNLWMTSCLPNVIRILSGGRVVPTIFGSLETSMGLGIGRGYIISFCKFHHLLNFRIFAVKRISPPPSPRRGFKGIRKGRNSFLPRTLWTSKLGSIVTEYSADLWQVGCLVVHFWRVTQCSFASCFNILEYLWLRLYTVSQCELNVNLSDSNDTNAHL